MIKDFFLSLVIFLILALGTAAAGFPLVIFILGNSTVKTAMVILYLVFSAIVVHYANQYKKEGRNE
jgi:cytochrome bd-type quinol oxidase subunit 2